MDVLVQVHCREPNLKQSERDRQLVRETCKKQIVDGYSAPQCLGRLDWSNGLSLNATAIYCGCRSLIQVQYKRSHRGKCDTSHQRAY